MILIVTHTKDYTVDFIANILNKRNLPFLRLNTDLLHEYEIEISLKGNLLFRINGSTAFAALWFRRVKFPDLPRCTNEQMAAHIKQDYDSLLFNILTAYPFERYLSHPYQIYQAENKIYQLRKAIEIGFTVPETLVTNSFTTLFSFLDAHPSIIKPIRSAVVAGIPGDYHIFTSEIRTSDLDQKDLTPCLFQEKIEKKYEVRVTVVEKQVFAFKIDSQSDPETSLDWRKKALKPEPVGLPEEVTEKCRRLVSTLNLQFGAIDFIVTPQNDYIFLEINPNGQWAWLELETGVPISEAIINFLYHEH